MASETLIGILIRLLPTVIVFVLGFVAASDKRTRERWGDLLYQVGSIKRDQRDNPSMGKTVKWPFFVVALALIAWPVQFYRHASKTIDATKSDLQTQTAPPSDLKAAANGTPVPGATAAPAVGATPTPPPVGDLRPAAPSNQAPAPAPAPAPSSDLVPAPR